MTRGVIWVLAAGWLACAAAGAQPAARAADPVLERLDTILALGERGQSLAKTQAALQSLFDEQIAYSPLDKPARLVEVDRWLRAARLARALPADDEARVFAELRAHGAFAGELALLWRPDKDKGRAVADLADRLMRERGETVDRFPALAAAVCVVFDEPRAWEFGRAPDAAAVLDHFASRDGRLVMSVGVTPADLLVHVVDTLAPPAELDWALSRYGQDRNIGKRYGEVPYDKGHFPAGGPLKLASVPATLENIVKVGGVCRHQAYYAAHTAKAQGVPSAVVAATGSGVSHAWLGFLEVTGRGARWNFDAGRFGEYSEMTGLITDPQTGERVSEGRLALRARAAQDGVADRRFAEALTDAAARLGSVKPGEYPPAAGEGSGGVPREAGAPARLALLEAGVRACPAYAPAWDAVTDLAEAGLVDPASVRTWAQAAVTLCGTDYPDFAVDTLAPLIKSMKDPPAQDTLWNWTFDQFSGAAPKGGGKRAGKPPAARADLAARIRFEQGAMWEAAGEPGKAWDAYAQVIDRYANCGPFVVEAASRSEKLLEREGKPADEVLKMYARAWGKVTRPGAGTSPEFLAASNYVRLGTRYATLLDKAGRDAEAEKVRRVLPAAPKKSVK